MSPDKVVEFLKRELECIKRCNNGTCSGDCLDYNSLNSIDLMSLDSTIEAYQTAIEIIEKRKTEEEQEREKNREKVTPEAIWEDAVNGYRCSTCNISIKDKYPYCPNCGAKMEMEE